MINIPCGIIHCHELKHPLPPTQKASRPRSNLRPHGIRTLPARARRTPECSCVISTRFGELALKLSMSENAKFNLAELQMSCATFPVCFGMVNKFESV